MSNTLIAEFMGAVVGKKIVAFPDIKLEDNLGIISNNRSFEDLHYHSSWDWLMPVVEKIECTKTDDEDNSDSFFNVMIEVFECNINGRDICICENGNTKLEATYRAVVEFINQYNKNNIICY
jgi:hypothetical protein